MIISHVVAAAENHAIGKDNKLLWHLPNDLKFFKNTTWAMPVVMGRKTFESMGKPLPGRINIVITRQKNWKADGVVVVNNWSDALLVAKETDCNELFVVGGGEIYRQTLPDTNRIYMTRVHANPEADIYYPEIDPAKWKLEKEQHFPADEKHAYAYSFQLWVKS
ncbi:MAG TPA: dihydrofolate reductase [Parasegetibacter sp.]